MKAICINNIYIENYASEGKLYEIVSHPHKVDMVYIVGNNGKEVSVRKDRFKSLDEYRLEKIEEILK